MRVRDFGIGVPSFCHILHMRDFSFILIKVTGDKKGKEDEEGNGNLRASSE